MLLNGLFGRRDPEAHIVIDADGRVMRWDLGAKELFGWTAAEVSGRRLSDFLIPRAWRAAHEAGLARMREGGSSRLLGREAPASALTASGEQIDIRMLVGHLDGHNGRARYLASIRRSRAGWVSLTPSGLIESASDSEKERVRRRVEEVSELLAQAQTDIVEVRLRPRQQEDA